MDLEVITLSEISKAQKDKYHMILSVESKRVHLTEFESIIVVSRGWGQ